MAYHNAKKHAAIQLCVASASVMLSAAASQQKERKMWVKKWLARRNERGAYPFIRQELLLEDPDSYRNYLRMDDNTFQKLFALVEPFIKKKDTVMRSSVSPAEKLAATLRFLATGETYQSMQFSQRLSKSFLSQNIPVVCKAIYSSLKDKYLKFPTSKEEWKEVADQFYARWQFPLCLGAIDGKHVEFRPLRKDGAYYRNYKGSNSIVLLGIADANCRFIYVDVGCNGRVSDGGVLQASNLSDIMDNELHFPSKTIIGNKRVLPYVFIADDAFPLLENLMKPFPYRSKQKIEREFNYRLSRARRCIEHAFGLMANRFRVLLSKMDLLVENVEAITLATCALHNFLSETSEAYSKDIKLDDIKNNGLQSLKKTNKRYKEKAAKVRDTFAQYFANEGKVGWQDDAVR